jgi:plasmid segregation protein ParM
MGDVSDILEIVLCGGGAAYIEPAVREVFPVQKIVCLPEPFFANANGFAMLSRKQMAGRELAHAE